MDWFPIVFFTFKIVALGTGMYFAIKWHYDQLAKPDKAAALRSGGKMAAIFTVSLLVLGLLTFYISRTLGLDLRF